jgi:hypothetical protein
MVAYFVTAYSTILNYKLTVSHWSKNSLDIMESEDPLLLSQMPATCPYFVPDDIAVTEDPS